MAESNSGGPRIVVVGAGPAGLATANYLVRRGYENVLVLERLGRVGGLCHTITDDSYSFDLGANYVTPAYKQIRKMARHVGARMYSERPFVAMAVPEDGSPVQYSSIFRAMRVVDGELVPLPKFLWANLKYCWLRWRLQGVVDKPTMAGIENHPELCDSFGSWLRANDIECLKTVFELPITLMGYGYVDRTPAVYALKFMTLLSFVPMAIKEMPVIGRFWPWPKRFVDGYQRFWQRVAWQLDVRLNVDISQVTRTGEGARIRYRTIEQEGIDVEPTEEQEIDADILIVACPLRATKRFLDLSSEEQRMVDCVRTMWYCMTTMNVEGLNIGSGNTDAGPLAACFPLREQYEPWGVAKQWDDSDFVQYYTPIYPGPDNSGATLDHHADDEEIRRRVIRNVLQTTDQMGGTPRDAEESWRTYNRWPYFQHVTTDSLKEGFYTDLERLQGQNNTFYVGGVTNFELVEPIAEYAKNLVETHFPKRR